MYRLLIKAEQSKLQGSCLQHLQCASTGYHGCGGMEPFVFRVKWRSVHSCFHGAKVNLPPFVECDVVRTVENLFW
jgi:hypothetical protein